MACIALHNMYVSVSGPCKPKWKLHVRDLGFIRKHIKRSEDTTESNLNRMKIVSYTNDVVAKIQNLVLSIVSPLINRVLLQ